MQTSAQNDKIAISLQCRIDDRLTVALVPEFDIGTACLQSAPFQILNHVCRIGVAFPGLIATEHCNLPRCAQKRNRGCGCPRRRGQSSPEARLHRRWATKSAISLMMLLAGQ
ncbi:hypothetical protein [Hyphomonas sp.]|uniref:hypothetical protein n=1 Tax=Hyphomonas sp. TaxID=87 RepID=UPI0035661306